MQPPKEIEVKPSEKQELTQEEKRHTESRQKKKTLIPEIASFAKGLIATKEEVKNALIYPESTGSVEGNINRLKMIKRFMYGRGNLDLLKQRVLYQL